MEYRSITTKFCGNLHADNVNVYISRFVILVTLFYVRFFTMGYFP